MQLIPRPRRIDVVGPCIAMQGLQFSERVDATSIPHAQGYRLTVTSESAELVAHDESGLFYGKQTIGQLQRESDVPACVIEDWPDFRERGVMLDISRDKVPTMQTLFALVDLFASLKINQLQLYTEHTFAYRNHRKVWEHASPMTHDEVRQLDAYCRERFIELVPNQNCFGHLTRWLVHEPYKALAECPNGYTDPWGKFRPEPMSLCPTDPGSLQLAEEWLDELLPCFTSRRLNAGCDETWDIGQGRSKAECEQRGVGRVYLAFLQKLHRRVAGRGFKMQFWADIILKHPELVTELPQEMTALLWGYEADHPFDDECRRVAESGREFYVCPGTSTWNSIAGRTENMLANIRLAAEAGLRHGATGLLNTDWGDNGHLQPLCVSYPAYACGAAVGWCVESNRNLDLAAATNRHVLFDDSNTLAHAMLDLGNVYTHPGLARKNGTHLFDLLLKPTESFDIPRDSFKDALSQIKNAEKRWRASRPRCPDATVILDELDYAAELLTLAAKTGLSETCDHTAVLNSHHRIWLARNRPGGMADSAAKLRGSK